MIVEITRTTALFPSAVFVQWSVEPDSYGDEKPVHYATVERSGGPTGPWETIAEALCDAYFFLDNRFDLPPAEQARLLREGLNTFSLTRAIYYRVTLYDFSGNLLADSGPKAVEPSVTTPKRLLKRKILRDESTALKFLNGVPLAVLKRRHWGDRCDRCWDPSTKETTLEHCDRCYGTSFRGGYWNPVHIRGRRDPAPVQTRLGPYGETESRMTVYTVLDYPALEKSDVIVDLSTGDRWIVDIATRTELRGVPVHQKVTCTALPRSSIEFRVPAAKTTTPPLY